MRRQTPNETVWQVYGIDGELLAEYAGAAAPASPQKEYGYRHGELLITAESQGQINWLVADHLGTPRLMANLSGSLAGIKRHDYLPFGEEVGAGVGGRTQAQGYAGDSVRQQFTGYERDDETGLDYAQARYYASTQGRFTSVDPYNIVMETQTASDKEDGQKQFVSYLSNPQRWHRYHYALNNPLLYTDPKGEDVTIYHRPSDANAGSSDKEFGHIFIYVRNDKTGESAYFDYYPDLPANPGLTVVGNVSQTRIDEHASLTIETSAEQEQAILDGIKEISKSAPNYDPPGFGHNMLSGEKTCVTLSQDLLKLGGININGRSPQMMWMTSHMNYSNEALKSNISYGSGNAARPTVGYEYGRDPRGQARRWDANALNARTKTIFKDGKIVKANRF